MNTKTENIILPKIATMSICGIPVSVYLCENKTTVELGSIKRGV